MLYPRLRLPSSATWNVSCWLLANSSERDAVPDAGMYRLLLRSKLWNGVSRVSAKVWHTAQITPLFPASVLRYWESSVANARPVPLSEVGWNLGSPTADSRCV